MNRIALALSVVAASTVLGGCAAFGGPTVSDTHFADDAEALNSKLAAHIPGILPLDAENVDLAVSSSAGARLRWTSPGGITATYCEPGPISGTPTDLGVGWWPKTVLTEGYDCGSWMVFETQGAYYAWDTEQ
ncbi:hypothetical protein EYE40_14250 [Glaciihabitans arcticus]|uniref:Lipoprotein n=1 Tax=Glaciihabitans arcticus TaxID=2668039 RepID=A0A4Q9GXV6_9MICO|nr:hypothetical protein [Glaciihabitans arcticus]TBN58458.1 hypothetical protein EYE40_14250 [Glaciihabitans arcticus]